MSKNSEAVKKWRRTTKRRLILSLGGKCCCCGYSKCDNALEFHHLDSDHKDFIIGRIRASNISWEKIIKEIRKCALVCSNCHKEIHAGIINLPENYPKFNEDFVFYKDLEKLKGKDSCPICGKPKLPNSFTCSNECSRKRKQPENIDEDTLRILCKTKGIMELSEYIGVPYRRMKRILNKFGLIPMEKSVDTLKKNRIVIRPEYGELKRDIDNLGFSGTGRKYSVSDNAIRKWIRFYEKYENVN